MDLLPLGFIFIIILTGPIIALLGDRLGWQIGKKRISYKKLRPRTVAQIGVAIAGLIIPFFTIALISLASADFRRWITEGRGAIVQRDALREDLADLRKEKESESQELARISGQLKGTAQSLSLAQTELKERSSSLTTARRQLDSVQMRVQALQTSLQRYSGRVAILERQSQLAQAQFLLANKSVTRAREALQVAQKNFAVISAQAKDAQNLAGRANDQYNETNNQNLRLTRANAQLEQAEIELGTTIKDLETAQQNLSQDFVSQKADLQAEKERIQNDLELAGKELEQRQQQLENASRDLSDVRSTFGASRIQPLIYRAGEEVSRLPIKPNLSQMQVQTALDSLLRTSRITAGNRGAKARGNQFPAAGIFDRQLPTGISFTSLQVINQLSSAGAGIGNDQVMIAYSSLNAFATEPVSLEIRFFPNPLIYRDGQVVLETVIDGRKTESEILERLTSFIVRQVTERARGDRMIPRIGQASTFGEIAQNDILKAVREVREAGRVVRVKASTISDTRAADVLRLKFSVQ